MLKCSYKNVEKHLEHIYEKLGVRFLTAAVLISFKKFRNDSVF